ncbi:MAG: chain length determinant protein EpsF [Steroidobacteraceae bacterium]
MKPLQILRILCAHYLVALLVIVVTIAAGVTFSLLMPKRYTTTTTLVFDVKSPDPVMGQLLPLGPGFVATQSEIIKSDRVAQRVVRILRLDENPTLKQQWQEAGGKGKLDVWAAELLQRGLQVTPAAGGSTIINLSFSAGDPRFAALVANAFAQVYIDTNIELRVDPARQASRWFGEQGKAARESLEQAQARLSAFQQQKGIVIRDDQVDTEMSKLRDLSSQLTVLQNETQQSLSKQRSGSDALPEVMQSSVVQSLRSEIARQEARLQETAANLGKAHPQYQRMQAEIGGLKAQLEEETRKVTQGFAASTTVGKAREANLLNAIAAQKKKILQLRTERDQLAVLQRDVDAAQAAYDAVTRRFNQTNLESQLTQTNVSVLNPAVEPAEPSSPNFKKNMAITVLLGLTLGGAAAFLLELLDRRVRSADDLAEMLQLPVLAVIGQPRKSSRLLFWRRPLLLAIK